MKQMAFFIDTSACIGCKTCELACKDKKNLAMGVRLRRVREFGGGKWVKKDGVLVPDKVFTYFVSAACMHCAQPACVSACPTGAATKDKDTGIVTINKQVCIGCGSCLDACPYKAPSVNEKEEKTYKCDMCVDQLSEGKNPICVDACLQRCIKVGTLEELQKKYGKLNSVPPLAPGNLTHPSVVIIRANVPQKSENGRIRNETEL